MHELLSLFHKDTSIAPSVWGAVCFPRMFFGVALYNLLITDFAYCK
jgi:hypothetical protein